MSGITSIFSRTSSLMATDNLLARLRDTQLELLETQKRLTTGKNVLRPSDDPTQVSSILFLREQLAARGQHERNLEHAQGVLGGADAAMGDALDVLRDAVAIASREGSEGAGANAQTRAAMADQLDAMLNSMVSIANRRVNGIYLFGGGTTTAAADAVFSTELGGVRYIGTRESLETDVGTIDHQPFNSNGVDAFGALSTRVVGSVDLDPQATADTRLGDLAGATLEGVRKGAVLVTVNGTTVQADLTDADTLDDVISRINNAIDGVSPGAGSLAINGESLELTGVGANTVSISNLGSSTTASDLGLELSSTGGVPDTGDPLNVRLTPLTNLADLGVAIDLASGIRITQGAITKTADFSSATTVQDLINEVRRLDVGLRLEINDDATGLNLVSEVSGLSLSVGENGGTTATDLGLRSLSDATLLSDFRNGLGVETRPGEDDFRVRLHDGTTFDVDLDGVSTVGELITAVETAATGAGLTVGTDFSVDHATTGNGLVFTDNTVGGDDFRIENLGLSLAADQLGIKKNAGGAATLTGDDAAPVRVASVFTHLIDLRDALRDNDAAGIRLAGEKVDGDLDALARVRARIGIEDRRVRDELERSQEMKVAEQTLLSEAQDADLSEVITELSRLQLQLQASLQAGAQIQGLSLLDFLR